MWWYRKQLYSRFCVTTNNLQHVTSQWIDSSVAEFRPAVYSLFCCSFSSFSLCFASVLLFISVWNSVCADDIEFPSVIVKPHSYYCLTALSIVLGMSQPQTCLQVCKYSFLTRDNTVDNEPANQPGAWSRPLEYLILWLSRSVRSDTELVTWSLARPRAQGGLIN